MLIDIHRHSSDRGNADLILRNVFHNEKLEEISEKYLSVGLHPWHINPSSLLNDISEVRRKTSLNKVIAIGEAGLDKQIATDFDLQRIAFEHQIEIALEYNKPMIIHCVKSYNEILKYKIDSAKQKPWVLHWFNGSYEMAMDLIKNGFYLSFGIGLFKESGKAFKVFQKLPLEYVFFETDDAHITISEVYKQASIIRGVEQETIELIIKENFKNCFRLRI